MNRDDDMNELKSVADLRSEIATGTAPHGQYGDSVGGRSFTDADDDALVAGGRGPWTITPAGPGITFWTTCRVRTDEELCEEEEWAKANF